MGKESATSNTRTIMEKDQVSLFKLVFTHNWEDPESDHAALKIKERESMMAITSGGCNVLGFLLFNPESIYSIDINPTQSHLLELKVAAIKTLSFDEFISFSGLKESENRLAFYKKISPLLSPEAKEFWDNQQKIIDQGFIMNGKYERFIILSAKFLNLLQGRKRVQGLLADKTKDAQENYFDKVWNTRRFHYLFKIMFNKRMLAKRGLVGDYFHFDDGSTSFAESFYNRSRKAFRNLPVKGNYFMALYLTGKFRNPDEVPAYLKQENYAVIKSRVDRIKIITNEAQKCLQSMPENSIDCFALSNICELMSDKDTTSLFASVLRTGKNNSRVSFRNLMIPREVPDEFRQQIIKDELLSRQIYENDRSFVYGKVAAYTIKK